MNMKRLLRLAVVMLFVVAVAGCGTEGDSETNGTLTLNILNSTYSSGYVHLKANANVTPAITGTDVGFEAILYYTDSTGVSRIVAECKDTRTTDITGVTTELACDLKQDLVFETTLRVTASIGGLHDTMWVEAIPAFTPQL